MLSNQNQVIQKGQSEQREHLKKPMKTKGKNKEPPEARENAATGLSFESDQCLIGLERSASFWTGNKAKTEKSKQSRIIFNTQMKIDPSGNFK